LGIRDFASLAQALKAAHRLSAGIFAAAAAAAMVAATS